MLYRVFGKKRTLVSKRLNGEQDGSDRRDVQEWFAHQTSIAIFFDRLILLSHICADSLRLWIW